MHRLLLPILLTVSLSGCGTLSKSFDAVSGAKVPASAVIAAANSFDAIEVVATNYLRLPRCTGTNGPVCRNSAAVPKIVKAIHAGQIARNNLEQFLRDNPGALGPSGPYNVLVSAISTLQGIYSTYKVRA